MRTSLRLFLKLLQGLHDAWRFQSSSVPPSEAGCMWSTSVAGAPHITHVNASRLSMRWRVVFHCLPLEECCDMVPSVVD